MFIFAPALDTHPYFQFGKLLNFMRLEIFGFEISVDLFKQSFDQEHSDWNAKSNLNFFLVEKEEPEGRSF